MMFGLETLDVIIGIITVYLVFALACTAIVEAISSWCDLRSKNLEVFLKEFLHGKIKDNVSLGEKEFVDAFFLHPIVQTLSKGINGRPSYITPEIVGQVVVSLIGAKDGEVTLAQAISALPGDVHSNRIKGLLDSLWNESKDDIASFRKLVENHFDAAMDRASGWYKGHTQLLAFIVAAVLVIGANVDTISLAYSLSTNPTVRARVIELAQQQIDAGKKVVEKQPIEKKDTATPEPNALPPNTGSGDAVSTDPMTRAKDRTEDAAKIVMADNAALSAAGIQLGWKGTSLKTLSEVISKIAGLLVSALAISLGAPFWFDMLNRIMQIRAAGVSPREKKQPAVGN